MIRNIFRVLLVLWAGSLWSLAGVAYTLFHVQSDRHLAGMVVGRLLTAETYLGVGVGVLALLLPGNIFGTLIDPLQERGRPLLLLGASVLIVFVASSSLGCAWACPVSAPDCRTRRAPCRATHQLRQGGDSFLADDIPRADQHARYQELQVLIEMLPHALELRFIQRTHHL